MAEEESPVSRRQKRSTTGHRLVEIAVEPQVAKEGVDVAIDREDDIFGLFFGSSKDDPVSQENHDEERRGRKTARAQGAHTHQLVTFNPEPSSSQPQPKPKPKPKLKRRVSFGSVVDAETGEVIEASASGMGRPDGANLRKRQRRHTMTNTPATAAPIKLLPRSQDPPDLLDSMLSQPHVDPKVILSDAAGKAFDAAVAELVRLAKLVPKEREGRDPWMGKWRDARDMFSKATRQAVVTGVKVSIPADVRDDVQIANQAFHDWEGALMSFQDLMDLFTVPSPPTRKRSRQDSEEQEERSDEEEQSEPRSSKPMEHKKVGAKRGQGGKTKNVDKEKGNAPARAASTRSSRPPSRQQASPKPLVTVIEPDTMEIDIAPSASEIGMLRRDLLRLQARILQLQVYVRNVVSLLEEMAHDLDMLKKKLEEMEIN